MKSIPARHTNIMGEKVFGLKSICTYIVDFEHKIQQYGGCCCSLYYQILWEHPEVACNYCLSEIVTSAKAINMALKKYSKYIFIHLTCVESLWIKIIL